MLLKAKRVRIKLWLICYSRSKTITMTPMDSNSSAKNQGKNCCMASCWSLAVKRRISIRSMARNTGMHSTICLKIVWLCSLYWGGASRIRLRLCLWVITAVLEVTWDIWLVLGGRSIRLGRICGTISMLMWRVRWMRCRMWYSNTTISRTHDESVLLLLIVMFYDWCV
jgi:hypothetical protein